MKHADIVKLHALDLITVEQRDRIIDHLKLKEESGRLMAVLAAFGAVLVVAGIVLLISANWDAIPRGVKIATGLVLMLAAWAGGWFLRERHGSHPAIGEGLYLVGAGLWLANIALIGQIYHLTSRPPNAILLWLAGIAATPWILRSRALFVLTLTAFVLWLGMEANTHAGLFGGTWEQAQMPLYGLVGLLLAGCGSVLRSGRWSLFSPAAEKCGLLLLLAGAYPLCWDEFRASGFPHSPPAIALLVALAASGFLLLAVGLRQPHPQLPAQWRWTWGATLAGIGALLVIAIASAPADRYSGGYHTTYGLHWLFAIALFVACLIQVQVGVLLRAPFLVNLALTLMALVLLAVYVSLFGSMATTGWMLLCSGLFLLGFGAYLERKRRSILRQIRTAPPAQP